MTNDLDRFVRQYADELGRAEKRQQSESSKRLPFRRIAMAAAGVGLAVGLVVAALPGGGSGEAQADVVEARAAVTINNSMLHYRVSSRADGGKAYVTEYWSASSPTRWRTKEGKYEQWHKAGYSYEYSAKKQRLYRVYQAGALSKLTANPDPVVKVTGLLAAGVLRNAGMVTVNGRPSMRFVGSEVLRLEDGLKLGEGAKNKIPPFKVTYDYRVDPRTYEPVQFKDGVGPVGKKPTSVRVSDFLLFKRLELNDETEKLLSIEVPPGTKIANVGPTKEQYESRSR